MLARIGGNKEREQLVGMLRGIEGIVVYDPSGSIKLTSGGSSDYYINAKRALAEPLIRRHVARMIARHVADDIAFVAASGHGGIPLGTEVSDVTGSKLTAIRERERERGLGGFIDGYVPKEGECGVAVDDVLTTGGSLMHIKRVVDDTGAKISRWFAVVIRGNPTLGFDVAYILRTDDL